MAGHQAMMGTAQKASIEILKTAKDGKQELMKPSNLLS
jgi:hypothetical protein